MRLISFLGKGNYGETRYTCNGQHCQTRYVAAALTQLFNITEVVVLATKEAEEMHWELLKQEFSRLQLPVPAIKEIPSGGNQDELWQQFEVIREAVTEQSPQEVIFDITHGFRAQPFFAAAVINYLRGTSETMPTMQAVYGEYCTGMNGAVTDSPIWDLSAFITLLDWSSALQSFIKTGHGAALAKLAKAENARIQKSGQENRPKKLSSLADSLKNFSANIATVRCPQLITGSERGSARNVLKLVEDSREEVKTHLKPLAPVLETLRERLRDIPANSLFGEAGHKAMSALAKLYQDYERYPEAAIVVREGWISLYADKQKTDSELLEPTERNCTEENWNNSENIGNLPQIRNDIQHGGFRTQPKSADCLIRDVEKFANQFAAKLPDLPIGKTYFISRHPGAVEWAKAEGFAVDECLEHFDAGVVQAGDTVLGTLPVNLIAEVCKRGGRYFHLTLELPAEARGKELTAEDMRRFGARLEEFSAKAAAQSA